MSDTITIPVKEWNEHQSRIIDIQEKIMKLVKDRENELLTPKEVQHLLKIGVTTYQRYLKDGVFEQIKIKGKAYVKRSEIDRLIEEGRI